MALFRTVPSWVLQAERSLCPGTADMSIQGHGVGAESVSLDEFGGTSYSVEAPAGQRTWIFVGRLPSA
jgi:hypothetical protein